MIPPAGSPIHQTIEGEACFVVRAGVYWELKSILNREYYNDHLCHQ